MTPSIEFDGAAELRAEFSDRLMDSRILVVDDSTLSRDILGACLRGAGYHKLSFAGDGRQALEVIDAQVPDLIILDLEMPVMDGFELCRHLRQDESRKNLPVLIQSGRDKPDDLIAAFDCGASDMVLKPIKKFELLARVRVHLEKGMMLHQLMEYRQRVAQELDTARDMQAALCPTPALIQELRRKFQVAIDWCYEPCSELGGDIWGLEAIDDRRLGFFIADMSGHGVAAAMNTFSLHSLLSRQWMPADDPAGYLADINAALCGALRPGEFATMLCGSLDISSASMIYASAGAPPPILMSRKAWDKPEFCPSSGMPIGLRANSEYRTHRLDFAPGSLLLLYSDALIETSVGKIGALAEQGLITLVAELARKKGETRIFNAILREFRKRTDGPLRDDLTAFCIGRSSL